jgi:hypothetical protein
MARPLVIIAGAGLAISAICLSLAALLAPRDVLSISRWSPADHGWWTERAWRSPAPFVESGEIVTRELEWTGDGDVEIFVPGLVRFERAREWRVTVTGPRSGVEHLAIDGGRIYFDAPLAGRESAVEVRIAGPALDSVGLDGSGRLILGDLDQDSIEIAVRGSGSVEGRGRVGSLSLQLFGSGNAGLGELACDDAEVSLFGSGSAEIAPRGDAEVRIFGSGDVRLRTRPEALETRVFGSGRIIPSDKEAKRSRSESVSAPRARRSPWALL